MSAALASPFEVSGAAHLPGERARTLLRIEHFPDSVAYRLGELTRLLARFGAARAIDEDEALALWRGVRDCAPLSECADHAIWRASLPPSKAAAFVADVKADGAAHAWFYDWGGGLVWLATDVNAAAGGAVHARGRPREGPRDACARAR